MAEVQESAQQQVAMLQEQAASRQVRPTLSLGKDCLLPLALVQDRRTISLWACDVQLCSVCLDKCMHNTYVMVVPADNSSAKTLI